METEVPGPVVSMNSVTAGVVFQVLGAGLLA